MSRSALVLLAFLLGCAGCIWLDSQLVSEYQPPAPKRDEGLADDSLDDKKPSFDETIVDRRPFEGWLVNSSAAVVKLDITPTKPDAEAELTALRPSYRDAVHAVKDRSSVLPSVNMLDGKAKQFDDGLDAAIALSDYRRHLDMVKRILEKVGKDSPAAPFLAAGLELAGVKVEVADGSEKTKYLLEFARNDLQSKPTGVYTWSEELATAFRFFRFFQREFDEMHLEVPNILAAVIQSDPGLLGQYQEALELHWRLTNPGVCLSLADFTPRVPLAVLCLHKKASRRTAALVPPTYSRETVLFDRVFRDGIPSDADLMGELVQRIRSGEIDLSPKEGCGWYDYQVHALETLLLPTRGQERDKLLLTQSYKKRMLEAFEALITKRRETHVRSTSVPVSGAALKPSLRMPEKIKPRLRVEPCPTYYLRTARAYDFLGHVLSRRMLEQLHGLKKDGQREADLWTELNYMRDLFYGLYLVSAEDLGLDPKSLVAPPVPPVVLPPVVGVTIAMSPREPAEPPKDPAEQERCYKVAMAYLDKVFDDPDLATDTRISVPVASDAARNVTRLWATLGVRVAKLEAGYARAPHIKPKDGGDWQLVEASRLDTSNYLIPVDEFAEVELPGTQVLTREELRAICDREKRHEAILAALRKHR